MPVSFFGRSLSYSLHSGQQLGVSGIAVAWPAPQLQVDSLQPLVPKLPQFSEKFLASGIASPAERGAGVVKTGRLSFQVYRMRPATPRPAPRIEQSRQLWRALSPRERITFARMGTNMCVDAGRAAAGNGEGDPVNSWAATLSCGACLVNVAKSRLRFAKPGASEP